jgi:septal ring factor EnvC (AmiA/AmiB activator)
MSLGITEDPIEDDDADFIEKDGSQNPDEDKDYEPPCAGGSEDEGELGKRKRDRKALKGKLKRALKVIDVLERNRENTISDFLKDQGEKDKRIEGLKKKNRRLERENSKFKSESGEDNEELKELKETLKSEKEITDTLSGALKTQAEKLRKALLDKKELTGKLALGKNAIANIKEFVALQEI